MRFVAAAAVVSLVTAVATGCQDKKTAAANRALWNENRALQSQVEQLHARLVATETDLAEREARIAELQKSLNTPTEGEDPGIAGIEATYDAKTRTLTVNLPGDVLFAPGSAQLRKSAIPTLDKIVAALQGDYAGRRVRVVGHTDSDPVQRSARLFKDNLELSLERAATVSRYLKSKGVDPKLVETVGFGENFPRDPANKALNRRVEIAVVLD